MINVPEVFKTKTFAEYPPGKKIHFEEFFYSYYTKNNAKTSREYLPIFWTNFYVSRGYGKNIFDLQNFLNNLDKSKKYFTVIDYADGILNDVSHLDLKVLSASGKGDYNIPLLTMPPEIDIKEDKKTFCSFIGVINGRHPLRERMQKILSGNPSYFIKEKMGYGPFINKMNDSVFSLCPRGYGVTSFRICEALSLNSIPVYIYDSPCIPFEGILNMSEYCIMISDKELNNIDSILKSKTDSEIKKLKENGKKVFEEYFTYEGSSRNIINYLK
jgi:hypothetical protein